MILDPFVYEWLEDRCAAMSVLAACRKKKKKEHENHVLRWHDHIVPIAADRFPLDIARQWTSHVLQAVSNVRFRSGHLASCYFSYVPYPSSGSLGGMPW